MNYSASHGSLTAYRNGLPVGAWASAELLDLYAEAERIANTLPDGSTERGLLHQAMSKIELADQYVEKRQRASGD